MRKMDSHDAGLVSPAWLGLFVILTIVFGALYGVAQSDNGALTTQLAEAQSKAEQEVDKAKKSDKAHQELSEVVGYNNPDRQGSLSSVQVIKEGLQDLNLGSSVTSLQSAIDQLVRLNNQLKQDISSVESQKNQMAGELAAAKSTADKIDQDKQAEIDRLGGQLKDEIARAQSAEDAASQTISSLEESNTSLKDEIQNLNEEMVQKGRKADREIALLKSRINEFHRKYSIDKEPNKPAGRVISVHEKLDLAYIDLGRKNRLRRGMRFEVFPAGANAKKIMKGTVEITDIKDEVAEVKIVDLADKFYPVVVGDVLMNPFYDPKGEKRAVLLGRFSGRFNRSQLSSLLAEVGIQVRDEVDVTTDYLILGFEEIVNGDPVPFEQNDVFKKAENLGVDIFPLRRIESFFAY